VSLTVKQQAYQTAYNKGLDYFETLQRFSQHHLDVDLLTQELHDWQQQQPNSLLWRVSAKLNNPPLTEFKGTIRYLLKHQQLQPFIDRSVQYIYLRDLGKAIDSDSVQQQCSKTCSQLQKWLLSTLDKNVSKQSELSGLFTKLKKWGLQDTFIWLYEKLLTLQTKLPEGVDHTRIIRQISKLTLGVLLHQLDGLAFDKLSAKQQQRITHAIKMGYYYGLTYPFIDDFLDADSVLTVQEQDYVTKMIRSTLEHNQVPAEQCLENSPNRNLIHFVYQELQCGFSYIKHHYPVDKHADLYNSFYVFFHAQESDRNKSLDNPHYSNEEIFVPCILKSSYSRILPKVMLGKKPSKEFNQIILLTGLFNQLHDDLTDLSEDTQANAVTPYSYYLKYHQQRPDLINPYQLYWSLLQYVGITVYGEKNRHVLHSLLNRSLSNHVQQQQKYGKKYLQQLLQQLDFGKPEFTQTLQYSINHYCSPPYLDKLLKINIEANLHQKHHGIVNYRADLAGFGDIFNQQLSLSSQQPIKHTLQSAANYSLQAGGKRLRPWLSYIIGHTAYGISLEDLLPLLRSIEYMHTASLIFDDLPSQDNANQRRGLKTLHTHCQSTATAELSALVLIFQAIEQQTRLLGLQAQHTLQLMRYSAKISQNICHGQQLDLHSQNVTTQQQLAQLSHYKTGYAIEAALVMPAILAQASEHDIQVLKDFAYHAGLIFQIKDDLLDYEGNPQQLGKDTHMDSKNQSSFVIVLGRHIAHSLMWQHYFQALGLLEHLSFDSHMLKHTLDLIVVRES
jgi:geranylgeranyl pyrophosphate synthase